MVWLWLGSQQEMANLMKLLLNAEAFADDAERNMTGEQRAKVDEQASIVTKLHELMPDHKERVHKLIGRYTILQSNWTN